MLCGSLQLRHLRETIPRVMTSVLEITTSPDQLHSQFSQSATCAAQDVNSFAQLMEDAQNREVMCKARESRENNIEGVQAWMVAEHDDWLEVKRNKSEEEIRAAAGGGGNVAELDVEAEVGDLKTALNQFIEAHPDTRASLDEETMTIEVRYTRL